MSEARCSYCGSTFETRILPGHVAFCSKRDLMDEKPGVTIPLRHLLFAFFLSALLWWLFWFAAFGARAGELPLDPERYPFDPPRDPRELVTATTTTTLPPLPQPVPDAGPVEQWRPLVDAYPGWNVDTMLDIMWCESRGTPTAENPRSTATGLFQIMWSIWYADQGPRSDLHDPWLNTQIAHQVWAMQGYGAWVCWS